jgi:hypothetical protein
MAWRRFEMAFPHANLYLPPFLPLHARTSAVGQRLRHVVRVAGERATDVLACGVGQVSACVCWCAFHARARLLACSMQLHKCAQQSGCPETHRRCARRAPGRG